MIDKPLIGLNMSLSGPADGEAAEAQVPLDYIDAIQGAGGVPLCIPPDDDMDAVRAMLARVQGFLFIGGLDYRPHHYGGHEQPESELMDVRRDRFDMALAAMVLEETDLPVLGVCGGHQLLALARGGGLVQDIRTEWQPPQEQPKLPHSKGERSGPERTAFIHPVRIQENSLVARSTGSRAGTDLPVNSFHHQAVDPSRVGRDLQPTAWSADSVIEALEPAPGSPWARSGRFVLGVQWHPERMQDHPSQRRLFRSLVEAAAEHRR